MAKIFFSEYCLELAGASSCAGSDCVLVMSLSVAANAGSAHRPSGSRSPRRLRLTGDARYPPAGRCVAALSGRTVFACPRTWHCTSASSTPLLRWRSWPSAGSAQGRRRLAIRSIRYTPRDWLFVLLLILSTVPYAWRRRWPTAAFLISMLSVTVLWLLGYNAGALPLLLMFGGYFVAVARPTWELVLCSAVALGCFALLWWAGGAPVRASRCARVSACSRDHPVGSVEPADFGWTSRTRVPRLRKRRRGDRSSEERLRIARELHDIIGHSLGTIAVQAGVGRHLMETDPGSAADALDNIARISRSSLDEVRAVVAALRDEEPPYQPAPGLSDLPELIEKVRVDGPHRGTDTPGRRRGRYPARPEQRCTASLGRL